MSKDDVKKFFGPNYFDPLRDLKNQAMGGTDNCEDCGMPKRGGDNELMFADDEMCDCSFEKAWAVAKAAPCPQCGAETGERCGKDPRKPANKCKSRRRSMESGRDFASVPSTWKE
jgi:hypothetical protein|tara:strand:+ start:155 stop:499 length:345 start_codon:yes stop_codon:yes gene_type:complete